MKLVDKTSPIPLYFQLQEILRDMIENDELKPHDPIPAEREFCTIQGVSRMTVNKAILSLVNEGLLYREQGKGTFVNPPKSPQHYSQLKSFTDMMNEQGLSSKTNLISFETIVSTKKLQEKLDLKSKDSEVFKIIRVRFSGNDPMVLETVYIPKKLCPDLSEEILKNNSLYKFIEKKYGYKFSKAREIIEPIKLTNYESDLLSQPEDALALKFNRITYTEEGYPIEYAKSILRSDKYKYEFIINK